MIPNELMALMGKLMVIHIGSRDNRLQTCEVMGWGVKPALDKKQITVFIPTEVSTRMLTNLSANKKIAVTFGHPITHELYQVKGTYLSSHTASEEETRLMHQYVNTFYEGYLKLFNYPEQIVSTFNYIPGTGVTFTVEEVYVQTPGPNAGNKIV